MLLLVVYGRIVLQGQVHLLSTKPMRWWLGLELGARPVDPGSHLSLSVYIMRSHVSPHPVVATRHQNPGLLITLACGC